MGLSCVTATVAVALDRDDESSKIAVGLASAVKPDRYAP
jgi:hypothetical protein